MCSSHLERGLPGQPAETPAQWGASPAGSTALALLAGSRYHLHKTNCHRGGSAPAVQAGTLPSSLRAASLGTLRWAQPGCRQLAR